MIEGLVLISRSSGPLSIFLKIFPRALPTNDIIVTYKSAGVVEYADVTLVAEQSTSWQPTKSSDLQSSVTLTGLNSLVERSDRSAFNV